MKQQRQPCSWERGNIQGDRRKLSARPQGTIVTTGLNIRKKMRHGPMRACLWIFIQSCRATATCVRKWETSCNETDIPYVRSRLDLVPPPSPAVIASGCPVSYRTPLINSLLQRQGPLNIPELALYPTACQLTTTSMAQWPLCRPPSFLQLPAGDIRVKRLARPETELPGDLFRSWRCREGSIPYSKVRATGPALQEGLRAEKIPYPPVAPTAVDRSESPLGCLPML